MTRIIYLPFNIFISIYQRNNFVKNVVVNQCVYNVALIRITCTCPQIYTNIFTHIYIVNTQNMHYLIANTDITHIDVNRYLSLWNLIFERLRGD